VLDSIELRALILAGGDGPERRLIFERFFAGGPPRKLVRAASRIDLERARALDVGCGYGVYLAQFSAASVGLDRSPERVAFARSLGLRAELRDVERAGWSRDLGAFDVVWLCDMLVHLREPQALLAELHGVLTRDARLVITEWLWPNSNLLARLLASCVPGGREVLSNPEHLHRFDRSALARMLDESGYEIVEQYNHTFANPLAATLTDSFWPPRTFVARSLRKSEAS